MTPDEMLAQNLQNIEFFGAELIVLAALTLVVFISFLAPDDRKRINSTMISLIGLIAALGTHFASSVPLPETALELFSGLLVVDPFTVLFKTIFLISTIIVVLMIYDSKGIEDRRSPEFFIFLLTIFLGMSLLSSGVHLLIIYLALETVSLPSYIIAAYNRTDRNSAEAGVKYLIYGAVSGGAFLYGATLLYGLTGAFTLSGIASALSTGSVGFGVLFALALILVGIGYKCSFFPMHMWVPDVYQGAPAAVGGFLSTAPKAAGFAILIRMSYHLVPALTSNASFTFNTPVFFFTLAAVTMTIGNVSALMQNNVKRLLGYSTVAHVGYMLMGYTLIGTEMEIMQSGFSAIGFYLIVYTLMNLGAFLVVVALDREWLEEYNGLFERAPLPAITMCVFLFSLTGIPPMAGFVAKFYLFSAVISAGSIFYYSLALIGVLNSVISFFYYAKIIKHMFLFDPETDEPLSIRPVSASLLSLLALAVIGLGVYWNPVVQFTQTYITIAG